METARKLTPNIIKAFLAISVLVVAQATFVRVAWASAGSPQSCTIGANCTIGEFLFDDEYAPITSATCTITSRYPDGTLFIDNQGMTAATQNDGWYSYALTTPQTSGYYRTQVCCTVGTEYLCVDKDFEAQTASATDTNSIASAVWGYSNRTLSSFGNLVSDIWNYSSRTLTSFGSLVADIWNRSTTGTSTQNTVVNELTETKKTADENRLLLEELVNKPIIQNFLEDEVPDLGSKIKDTRAVANQLFVNSQYITSRTGLLIKDWNKYEDGEILDNIIELNEILGEESEISSASSVFGSINWIESSWDWEEVAQLKKQVKQVKLSLDTVQTNLASTLSSDYAKKELTNLFASSAKLDEFIGTTTDNLTDKTLYGKIYQTEQVIAQLDLQQEEIESLLSEWENIEGDSKTKDKLAKLKRNVLAINKVPKGNIAINNKADSINTTSKNSLLAMRGLIVANKLLLSKKAGDYFSFSWIEEGSIIVKSLVINPSKLINQEAELKYYLPPEVGEEEVLLIDEPLAVKYDFERDQFYIEGKIPLAINETKIFSVKLEDIWAITYEEIESYRQQAEELVKPLVKTSYYAQGITLKADINASLDKIVTLQKSAVTPEQRIRAYREALIEKYAADEKLSKLADLVSLAGNTGTLTAFIGGSNALLVWGLIIIMITGFVFLTVYMKKMTEKGKKKTSKKSKDNKKTKNPSGFSLLPAFTMRKFAKLVASFLVFGMIVAGITGFIVAKVVSNSFQKEIEREKETQSNVVLGDDDHVAKVNAEEEGVGGQEIVKVEVPEGSRVNVRSAPKKDAEIVDKIKVAIAVVKIGEEGDWINIVFEGEPSLESITESQDESNSGEADSRKINGWIHKDFIVEPVEIKDETSGLDSQSGDTKADVTVVISETPTGWLRVRQSPEGKEIGKVYPEEEYTLIEQNNGWYQIEYQENELGWIFSEYATLK
ncbi:hypothetical protein A2V80_01395 [Candidatus Woesebacteria bacterium RBG_16_39_8b]|uniref:SH3b domain-containing protein n=1 Tax=Candidatus Woesebacteria bacterium RBG_16_39_8b TaxID=1802482 RepID=A0A1F7X8G6_9BACT|nr:MAG: hypothetical protein A2V80_01395 [Candidatus Woesebacteria bacterium RBG_16_39_8b]